MPQTRSNPPPVMTWSKASPVLVVALIFDGLRILFDMFWFFGPAMVAIYCTIKVNGILTTVTFGLLGAKTAGAVCTTGAIAAGIAGAAAITTFGIIMAMAIGFLGWLTVGFIIMSTNSRIFKDSPGHALWFVGSLIVSEIPIVDAFPALITATTKIYSAQIKNDKEKLRKYVEQEGADQSQTRNEQAAQLIQARQVQAMQAEQQEAANDEAYAQSADSEKGSEPSSNVINFPSERFRGAAAGEPNIPQKMKKAA